MIQQQKDMKIGIKIPFIFQVSFANYGLRQGKFSIRFLPFSFYIGLYYGCGWSITPEILKWCFELRSHLKRVIIIFRVGISELEILLWQINRLERKLGFRGREK